MFCCLPVCVFAQELHIAWPSSAMVEVGYEIQSSVTLHEPVVVIFSVHNGLPAPITLNLGADNQQYFQFSLVTPEHRVLQNSWHPRGIDVLTSGSGTISLEPGQDYRQPILLSKLFSFETTGTYVLTSQLSTNIDVSDDGALPPLKKTAQLQITSRDRDRLDKICAQLAAEAESAGNVEAAHSPTLALSYIHDPVAVPYLARLVYRHTLEYDLAISGLERIANDDAVEALLSEMDDKYGEIDILARQALTRMQNRISNPKLRETVQRSISG
jgi:hypothetical protein